MDDPKNDGHKRAELDFGDKVDVSDLMPFWTDEKTGGELCEAATKYILRTKSDDTWEQAFSVNRLMCQKPISREQAIQLVTDGKTDLIQGFISKRGRPFDAHLLRNGGKIGWEFPPRKTPAKGAQRKKKEIDYATATKLGGSRAHGEESELFKTAESYIVRKPNSDGGHRVVFELKNPLLDTEIPAAEVERLLTAGKTNLIEGFVSKRGAKFSAYLVLAKGKDKADFEFPPR